MITFDLTEGQEAADRFYWSHGAPCCAGCDWWRHHNSMYGDCLQSAPVSEAERWAMTGITGASALRAGAGHVVTPRNHVCGQFADTFNWSSLPPAYRRRIGAPQ